MSKQNAKQISSEKWTTIKIGDIVKIVNENEYEPIPNKFTKYVAGAHIESDKIKVIKYGDIVTNQAIIGSAFHRVFRKGQLLFGTRRAYLRKAGIATFDGICSNTTLVLDSKNEFFRDLMPFIFHWEKFQNHAIENSVGSTNPYVRWRDIARFEFQLPSNAYIKQMSTVLWKIQHLIEKTQNLQNEYIVYGKSLLEKLLTKGMNKQNLQKIKWLFGKEIEIPKTWNWERLSDNSILKGRIGWQGLTTTEYRHSGKFYLVTGTDFKKGKIDWENCVYVEKSRYDQDVNIQLQLGDILVTKDGTIGKVAYVDSLPLPTTVNTGVFVIRPKDKNYISEFLYHVLCSDYFLKFLNSLKAGSTIDHLYQRDFQEFYFPIPPSSEQEEIILTLRKHNNSIKKIENYLEKLYYMRKNLTDSLLSQKVTLKEHSNEN